MGIGNWEALFRILFFVGYSGFFSAYYQTKHRNKLAQQADREWSVNPFRFISVSPYKCGVNFSTREISLRVEVHNSYMKSRRVWISANVAIYRNNFARPLFTVPLPVIAIDAAANSVTEASPMWPAMMEPDQSREALTVYKSDKMLRVQLVNVTTTTLADLSRDPKAVSSNPPPNLKPIAIEDVYYE